MRYLLFSTIVSLINFDEIHLELFYLKGYLRGYFQGCVKTKGTRNDTQKIIALVATLRKKTIKKIKEKYC